MSAFLFRTAKVVDDSSLRLAGTSGLVVADLARGPVLYATARGDSGLSAFRFHTDGQFELIQSVSSAGARKLLGAGDLVTVEVDGSDFVVTTAFYHNAVQAYSLAAGGQMISRTALEDDVIYDPKTDQPGVRDGGSEIALFGADSIESFDINGQPHIAVGASYDGSIMLASLGSNGTITPVSSVFDTDQTHLAGIDDFASTVINGQRYFVAVSPTEQGISVFSLGSDGQFVNVDNVSTGPEIVLGRLTSVEITETAGGTYVIVAGRGNWPVSVFHMDGEGALTLTDRVTGAEAQNIFNSFSITSFSTDGKTFVAFGSDKGGISIFRLADNGKVSLITEIDHDLPSRTGPTDDLIVKMFGDKVFILAAGQAGDGFTSYRFFPDAAGIEHMGSVGNDVIIGSLKHDVLVGLDGNDVIRGKSGGDRILDGDGKDLMWGGPGRDVFEFTTDGKQDKIQDFQDGFDRIDISGAGVTKLSDIQMTQVNSKTLLMAYADETIFVKGYSGSDLSVAQLDTDDFIF